MEKLLVSVEEAAEALSMSKRKLDGMLLAGEIHSLKSGRRRLVPVRALEAWIAEKMGGEDDAADDAVRSGRGGDSAGSSTDIGESAVYAVGRET